MPQRFLPWQGFNPLVTGYEALVTNFSHLELQERNPNDILLVLIITGGDVVHRAIAQLSSAQLGPIPFVPVSFSFGWVAYSLRTLLSAVGDDRLMPDSDYPCKVINAKTGYTRPSRSWVLGRFVRDHMSSNINDDGLTVVFYETSKLKEMGTPDRDWVYYSGVSVILAQIGIAIIPGLRHGDWGVLGATFSGTLLALTSSALPQWRREKWKGRKVAEGKREVTVLTQENGSKEAIVIISDGAGIKFEDLATGRDDRLPSTKYCSALLFASWLVHLMVTQSSRLGAWYLLGIGAMGTVQTVLAARAKRTPSAHGFHLEERARVYDPKVFGALKKAEQCEPRVGISLLPVFFPGNLREDEVKWRDRLLEKYTIEESKIDIV